MTAQDLEEVVHLEMRAFADPWPEMAFLSDLDKPDLACMRVARQDGRLAGYMAAWRVAGEIHLTNLAVEFDFRRQGVGQALLDELFDEAKRTRAHLITLEVRKSNHAAIALYLANGFRQVGLRRQYYSVGNEDALVLAFKVDSRGEVS